MWLHRLFFFSGRVGKIGKCTESSCESTQYNSLDFLSQTKLRFEICVTCNKIHMGILCGNN